MKAFFTNILIIFFFALSCHGQKHDFGTSGLKGLSSEQLSNLSKGEIVFLSNNNNTGGSNNSLIEAAIVFNVPPETTWRLISKTEDQPKYIKQCKSIQVVSKSPGISNEVHSVGNWMVTYTYGVTENYIPDKKCIYWMLDKSYSDNDLVSLNGYWQFYPYGKGKTIARYGSSVSFKNIPEFVENMFKKGGVDDALSSVKKYVDSGGTYRK